MSGSIFEILRIVLLVTVVIPMMMGFVFSVLGLATIEISRYSDRRRSRAKTKAATGRSATAGTVVLAGADT